MHPSTHDATLVAKPFLKWAGGKTQLLGQLRAYYPAELATGDITRYVEPFVGGGAVFLDVMQRSSAIEAFLYDINPELIVAYTAVQRDPQGLIDLLTEYRSRYMQLDEAGRSQFFYAVREHYNAQKATIDFGSFSPAWTERAADLIFLNKTCFNGLFRVNASGQFNVPFGSYVKPEVFDSANIHAVSRLLQRAAIQRGSFEMCRDVVNTRTFVYFDPPYRPLNATSSFTSYAADRFDDTNQRRLAEFYASLDATTGARLLLSNSDPRNNDLSDSFFDDLYADFIVLRVAASRLINADADGRGVINEILVANYSRFCPVDLQPLTRSDPDKPGKRENDKAWSAFFESAGILGEIESKGYSYITAAQLKRQTGREARLLAKLDTLDDRPPVFKEHDLTIFPVKNGEYILFRDPENKSYFRLSDADLELAPRKFQSKVDLARFNAFPGLQRLNESQALDFAFVSSLLQEFTGDPNLHLVIRGRSYSGHFAYTLPHAAHRVEVNSVQIEIDGGYESPEAIYLVEAKIGRRADFHIRQLYYPYLEWSARSSKRIVPIFVFVTNGKFYFYEFGFDQTFGGLAIVRSASYIIDESPAAPIRLSAMLQNVTPGVEPQIPFPQANDLDKVVDLAALLRKRAEDGGVTPIGKAAIAEHFEFNERQGDYYANAGMYLGLLSREQDGYVLTDLGRQLVDTTSLAQRTKLLLEQMLQRPVLRDAIELLRMRALDLEQVGSQEIVAIIRQHTGLSGATPTRRASTVIRWLRWIKDNAELAG